jgi:polysaccharide pyruvyl transferase WcaK-like protein
MKKKLIVRGFFGRGNCGDEAILQSIHKLFGEHYDIGISTELSDVNQDVMRTLFPYANCEIVNCEDRLIFKRKDVAGFILGGGGLGLGFGWNQYIVAKRRGVKVVHIGTHLDASFLGDDTGETVGLDEVDVIEKIPEGSADLYNVAVSSFLRLADYYAVRNKQSVEYAKKLGVTPKLYPDVAFALDRDNSPDVPVDKKRMLVTIREYPPTHQDFDKLKKWLVKIEDYATKLGMYIKVIPYCEADAKTTREVGYGDKMIDGQYWNPRRVKQWVANSGMVVSFGRFHAVVFAISEGIPVISIDHAMSSYKNKATMLLNDSRLGEFRFTKDDEDRDCYDIFKKAMTEEVEMKIASIGHTNRQLVLKMRDEILQILK